MLDLDLSKHHVTRAKAYTDGPSGEEFRFISVRLSFDCECNADIILTFHGKGGGACKAEELAQALLKVAAEMRQDQEAAPSRPQEAGQGSQSG